MSVKKMKKLQYFLKRLTARRPSVILFLTSFLLVLGLWGCSNETPPETQTASVDITALKQQLAQPETTGQSNPQLKSPDTSAAVNVVKSLIIGPLSFQVHGKKYSFDEAYSTQETDFIDGDLPQSVSSLTFVSLPTSSDQVQFEVPVASSGWQVLVLASTNNITSSADLLDTTNQNSLVYYGFSTNAYETASDLNDANATMEIKRLCIPDSLDSSVYSDPVKGCAIYDDQKEALISAAVEILGVNVVYTSSSSIVEVSSSSFPLIVRSSPNSNQTNVTSAKIHLNGISTALASSGTISSLEIVVSHRENTNESTACQALSDTASVATYKATCETQSYKYVY